MPGHWPVAGILLVEGRVVEEPLCRDGALGDAVDEDGEEREDVVVEVEEQGLVESHRAPVGVEGEEELDDEAGHVLVERVLDVECQPSVVPRGGNMD